MYQLTQVHQREPTEERRSLGGLNHCDNLLTEQNCAHTNKLLIIVNAINSHPLITEKKDVYGTLIFPMLTSVTSLLNHKVVP